MIITKMCDFIKWHRPVLDLKKYILHLLNLVYDLGALYTEINISKYINLYHKVIPNITPFWVAGKFQYTYMQVTLERTKQD